MNPGRATRLWHRIDVRVAAWAGLIAATLLVSGVLWFRAELNRQQMSANELMAQTEAGALLSMAPHWDTGGGWMYDWLPYQLFRADGTLISQNNTDRLRDKGWTQPLPDPAAGPPPGTPLQMSDGTTYVLPPDNVNIFPTGARDQVVVRGDLNGYHVYVYVTPHAAEWPVVPMVPYPWWGAALAWLLITATAAVAVRLALRPVERMRREAALITSTTGGSRLATTRRHDELSALAATLDTMLGRLDESFRAQQRFTADAAHELRGPLASLRASVEIALAHPDDIPADETLCHVLAETDRLQELTEQLLAVARASSSRADGPVSCEVGAAVAGVLDGYPPVDRGRVEVPDRGTEPTFASIGPDDLHRVLRNLLDNALRHAATGVHAEIAGGPDLVVLTVANDGAPIPDDQCERIFEPFVRLDDARSRDDGGTGLGLTIVRSLVERVGGTVTAGSRDGETSFVVRLPGAKPTEVLPSSRDVVNRAETSAFAGPSCS